MQLQYRRADGSFVAIVNGLPYHVVEGDQLYAAAAAKAAEMSGALPYEPPPEPVDPEPLKRLYKTSVWARLTDPEVEAIDAMLAAAPTRLRRIFDAAQYLDLDDPNYPLIREGVEQAIGSVRADTVLQPDH